MATLLIDNHDSFSFNLAHLIASVYGEEPVVVTNDDPEFDRIDMRAFEAIFISPGPGHPGRSRDFGVSKLALHAGVPVLGVCLGHQGICHARGGRVGPAPEPVHGRTSDVFHDRRGLFAGIPSPFRAARYHSLVVTEVPAKFEATAWAEDGTVMAVSDRHSPTFGVQFHPESIASEFGAEMIANFRSRAGGVASRRRPRQPLSPSTSRPRAKRYRQRWRRLDLDLSPARVFDSLYSDSPVAFWLDGTVPYGDERRFTYMGDDSGPLSELVTHDVRGGTSRIVSRAGTRQAWGPFLELIDRELGERTLGGEAPVPFGFGYAGFLGYELKAECGGRRVHRSPGPDAGMLFADRLLAFDHAAGAIFLGQLQLSGEAPDEAWLDRTATALEALAATPAGRTATAFRSPTGPVALDLVSSPDDAGHIRNVEAALSEILAGESYEVCLTRQTAVEADLDLSQTWSALRRSNPAPYAALLRLPGMSVLSCSPERFLKVTAAGGIESRPIKGTAPRGGCPAEDDLLRDALRNSAKDRAENLMIVDLVRNDLARVSEPGSVEVTAFAEVERLPSAHQLVSTVTSRLASDRTAIDCVRAAFPGGSMTGAPKLRTMEIIDRLEGSARGAYSGALGWIGLDGSLDLGIVIRALVVDPAGARIGSGGAIVAQSDPAAELAEADLKRRSVLDGLRLRVP